MAWADFLRKVPVRDESMDAIFEAAHASEAAHACKICGCSVCPMGHPCSRGPRMGKATPCRGCGCVRGNSQYNSPAWGEGEQEQMIKVQRNNPTSDGASAPRGVQFLSPRHVDKTGSVAKITKVTTDKPDNFGNPYVVYFLMNREKYSKGFKATSANLIALVDLLGDDEGKWKGKDVRISKVQGDEGDERLAFSKA